MSGESSAAPPDRARKAAAAASKLPTLEYLPASSQLKSKEEKQQKLAGAYIEEPSAPAVVASQNQLSFYDEVQQNRPSKLYNFAKYNPFVPIGCLITLGVLANGVWAMRKRDTAKSQRMMRYRIAAQGTTIIALVMGTMLSQYLMVTQQPPPPPPPNQ